MRRSKTPPSYSALLNNLARCALHFCGGALASTGLSESEQGQVDCHCGIRRLSVCGRADAGAGARSISTDVSLSLTRLPQTRLTRYRLLLLIISRAFEFGYPLLLHLAPRNYRKRQITVFQLQSVYRCTAYIPKRHLPANLEKPFPTCHGIYYQRSCRILPPLIPTRWRCLGRKHLR